MAGRKYFSGVHDTKLTGTHAIFMTPDSNPIAAEPKTKWVLLIDVLPYILVHLGTFSGTFCPLNVPSVHIFAQYVPKMCRKMYRINVPRCSKDVPNFSHGVCVLLLALRARPGTRTTVLAHPHR